jgi:hypothetical protein
MLPLELKHRNQLKPTIDARADFTYQTLEGTNVPYPFDDHMNLSRETVVQYKQALEDGLVSYVVYDGGTPLLWVQDGVLQLPVYAIDGIAMDTWPRWVRALYVNTYTVEWRIAEQWHQASFDSREKRDRRASDLVKSGVVQAILLAEG